MSEKLTPEKLKKIREGWGMTQAEFAELLGANLRTYQGWESGRFDVPGPVAEHIRTIQSLKKIYAHWDQIASPLAGMEEFDAIVDDHEKLWGKLFPMLKRE